MRCYNHHEIDAVGICKSCGRALCPSCAAEVEKAVACRGRCETDVSTLLSLNRNALTFAKGTKQARYLGPAMLMAIGAMLVSIGLSYDGVDLATGAGAVVVAVGIALLVIQYRMAKGLRA